MQFYMPTLAMQYIYRSSSKQRRFQDFVLRYFLWFPFIWYVNHIAILSSDFYKHVVEILEDMVVDSYSITGGLRNIVIEICVAFVSAISLSISAVNLLLIRRIHEKSVSGYDAPEPGFRFSNAGRISVIIATKNESRHIGQTMRNLESNTADKSRVEIIIVDVGSIDSSIEVARASSGAIPVTFIKRRDVGFGGRGTAINDGFEKSSGEFILILKADSLVPPRYDEILRQELDKSNTVFAAFRFSIDRKSLTTVAEPSGLWILALYFNLRSSLFWFPSAMQGLALSAHSFESQKFSDDIIMDDISFSLNLRNICLSGNLEFKLLDESIKCSPMRWESVGVLTWLILDSMAYFLHANLQFCPDTIYLVCYDFMPHFLRTLSRRI